MRSSEESKNVGRQVLKYVKLRDNKYRPREVDQNDIQLEPLSNLHTRKLPLPAQTGLAKLENCCSQATEQLRR